MQLLFVFKLVDKPVYLYSRCIAAVSASRGIKYWPLDNLCGCYWHLFLLRGVPGFIPIW